MQVRKIIETAIYCDSVPEMQEFYERLFGFEAMQNPAPSERACFFKCGTSILIIFNRVLTTPKGQMVPEHGSTGPGHIAIEIDTGTAAEWKELLISKGVEIEKEISWERHDGATSIYFRDPANNSIELVEAKLWNI